MNFYTSYCYDTIVIIILIGYETPNNMADSDEGKKTTLEREFIENTSFHGISRITDSKKFILLRIAWFLLFFSLMGLCLWTIYTRVAAYIAAEVNTKVSRVYTSPLEFPAVTICNFNR